MPGVFSPRSHLVGAEGRGRGPRRRRAGTRLAQLGRRYPLYRGHGWLAHHVFPPPRPGSDGSAVEVRLRGGLRVLVYPDEYIGRIVFYFGDLDPRISWVCRRLLRPGDAVVDVGANYGVVSLLAAQLVGNGGIVHAVEPQPEVAALLRRSAERNSLSHLHVHEVALSDSHGERDLTIPVGHLGGASLTRTAERASVVPVRVHHAGTFLSELGLPHIRMLKLDIEGHEAQFLEGAGEFLRGCGPDVVVFESNDALYESGGGLGFWQRKAVRQLHELGYDMLSIGECFGAWSPKLSRVPLDDDDDALDFVAVNRRRYRHIAGLLGVS